MEENKKIPGKQLSNTELSYFCGQLALVLHSGISALEGLNMMQDDYSSADDKKILDALYQGMMQTGYLHTALRESGIFPNYMVQMVQIGEETGNLDDVMQSLQNHYEREAAIRSAVTNAVTYPLIMSGMILAVIVVLLVRVMPIFSQVFRQLGTEVSGLAAGLITLGDVISRYSIVFVITLVAIIAIILICVKTNAGKKLAGNIPAIRQLNSRISASRFAGGMALTLKSGLGPGRSFELVSSLNEDKEFAKRLDKCQELINEGEGIAEALHTAGIFGGVYARMASIGNKTGAMDQVMEKIAGLYQEEVDTRINNTLAVLEPALIIVLSVIVGIILMSVMFPLLGIMSSI